MAEIKELSDDARKEQLIAENDDLRSRMDDQAHGLRGTAIWAERGFAAAHSVQRYSGIFSFLFGARKASSSFNWVRLPFLALKLWKVTRG